LVIGARLAKNLGAEAGDMITVYSVSGLSSSGNLPDIRRFRVGGIYETGIDRFDDVFVLGALDVVRQLVGVEHPAAHSIDIRLKDVSQIRTMEAALDTVVPFPYLVETVYLRYANIFAWIRLQEQTVPLVIGVMILIAAFNLIGTVLMMVLERVRDIGILKTMGATQVQIRRIFLAEGMIVGVVGLVIGVSIAMLFSWVQGTYGIIPLDQENYYMSTAPVQPQMIDYIWVSGVTMLLCMAASWLPSNVAAKINPLNVIQFGR
jgi:lipoprotein-releasing system permease protein